MYRNLFALAVFLVFADDAATTYGSVWTPPFGWVQPLLLEALPYKVRFFEHVLTLCLFATAAKGGGRKAQVAPVRKALFVCIFTLVLGFLYGLARGGSAWAGSWQLYLLASGVLFAFSASAVFRTPADFGILIKAMLAAAAYRALMCWLFYIFYIHPMLYKEQPEYLTSHDDTVLWVTAVLFLILRFLEKGSIKQRIGDFLFLLLLVGAIFFNQRRLAWVSLAMGLMVLIALLPKKGKARRKAFRVAAVVAPIIVVYATVGWGRKETIFKPLQSFATVSTTEDASTKARNAENMGLILTSLQSNTVTGTGWGHPYVEYTNKYSIAQYFPLWQYIPHNSILGFLAFSGVLGFFGYWMIFPTSMFMNARMARYAPNPQLRHIGLMGCVQAVVCANQFYGDMGSYYVKSVYMLALSYAFALRLPLTAGVWGPTKKLPAQARAV